MVLVIAREIKKTRYKLEPLRHIEGIILNTFLKEKIEPLYNFKQVSM